MELTALLLSRIQFGFTIAYHIVFPSLSMGMALFLVLLEAAARKTGDARYTEASIFWSRIFALSFGMGVVTGVVLSYEIGTNFGRFAEVAGPVVGPLMSYEVMSAFFLEAGFLGIVLFGRRRVSPNVHFFATCMVALGTLMSAFWILSANSFMHTPAGYTIVNGALRVSSWRKAIFNPSFPYRFAHMVTAAYLSTSFVVAAVGAWFLLKQRDTAFALTTLRFGLVAAAVLAPTQIMLGDLHGLNTLQYQPLKVSAIEGHWHTSGDVPLVLFGWPDEASESNKYEVTVPMLGSIILTHSLHGEVRGLATNVAPEDRPPVAIVFWAFRIMVGLGLIMLAVAWTGVFLLARRHGPPPQRFLQLVCACGPIGFFSVLAGWITTEVGRQPWTVYGILRTRDAASIVPAGNVMFTLSLFIVVYALLFYAFSVFFARVVRRGPGGPPPAEEVKVAEAHS